MDKAKTGGVTPITVAVYIAKLARLSAVYIALWLAVRVFEAGYVSAVYGRGEEPPPLLQINVALSGCLGLVVCTQWLLLFVGTQGKKGGTLGLSQQVIWYLLKEGMFYTALVLLCGIFLSVKVSRKKYFRYKTDGLRAIRAFKDLLLAAVVPVGVLPFYFGF